MNILILSWRGPGHPNSGGAEISTHEHAKGWVRDGHDVTLFTSYFRGAKREEILDGVKIKRAGRQMFGVQWEAFKWYLFANHEKFDLVIDQFHGIPFFTPLYVRIKKLGFIHEVAKEIWRLNPWPKPYNLFPAILGTIFEPLIFKLIYKNIPFMTVSNSTKQDLISWDIPSDSITVIHNGVIIPKDIQLPEKEKTTTLIFLGALSKDKGIEDALKVFSILSEQNKDWKFWVVGKGGGEYQEILERKIKQLGLINIKFWGYVSEKKKFELLSRAHLFVNPAVREGWGLVVIEGASCGTPTVAFNVPGLRDSIKDGETGVLAKKHSVENLAEAVRGLLADQEKYLRISKNAVIWSKNFSWEKSTLASLKLIEKIAS